MSLHIDLNLETLQEILEDIDIFGFIKQGSYADTYDAAAISIHKLLNKDMTAKQIQNVLWNCFYDHYCCGFIHPDKTPFSLSKEEAVYIIGSTDRYKNIASVIRDFIKF